MLGSGSSLPAGGDRAPRAPGGRNRVRSKGGCRGRHRGLPKLEEFQQCYDPSWGRYKARTAPAPGNHEYKTRGAAGYYVYFGATAGDPARGYYSYDLGSWHLVALNSECDEVGGCGPGSPQEEWLRRDLAASAKPCTLAYWHHPLRSSGRYAPGVDRTGALWRALHEAGAEVVLNGHDHLYERFAPQDPAGARDDAFGLRQFTVGTGGARLYRVREVQPHSEVRYDGGWAVLGLTLRPDGYDWRFVPTPAAAFTDAGSASCHGSPRR